MLRPPQPAVYVFCLDVSHAAVATGYLKVFCDTLLDELEKLPGDSRTQIGFITYDRVVHFYSMSDGATQPTQLVRCCKQIHSVEIARFIITEILREINRILEVQTLPFLPF